MGWFWPVMGVLATGLIVLAWLSDRSAKRKGMPAGPADIARNLRAAKWERRQRLTLLRRSWVPTDDRPKENQQPWRNR